MNHSNSSSRQTFVREEPKSYMGNGPVDSASALIEILTENEKHALQNLVTDLNHVRWLEISGRLQKFYKANVTSPSVRE